jgi:peptidoglycan/xylan/chitin deacetylase (PgdA/CDA1 family)
MPTRSPFMPSEKELRQLAAIRRRRQVQRRRAIALGALGVLVLAVSIAIEAGGSGQGRKAGSGTPRVVAVPPPGEATRRRLAAENRAIDRVMDYASFVASGGGTKREIALTFDDGPGPYTPQVLRILRQFHVKATFFEVGFMERWFHASTTTALQEGHTIGDHTERHAKLARLKRPEQRKQIVSQAEWLQKLGAPRPRLFRPPFGSFDARTFRVLRNNRMLMVLWSVDSQDYRRPGAKAIVRRVLNGAKPGAIVLMHDAGGRRSQTVAALPEIIRRLRKRNFKLVTVPQLIMEDPPPPGQRLPRFRGVG